MKTIEKFRGINDDAWLQMLINSIDTTKVDGLKMPRFPSDEVQSQFVGSSRVDALREGAAFYKLAKAYAAQLGRPISLGASALDFGCGWGRYLRFLWKDVAEMDLYGVDTDPDILAVCRETGVPGQLSPITPMGKLPYPDRSMDVILAYSVFTHLPEPVFLHWMQELSRVSRPGCIFVFTIEPRRFLEFVGSLAGRQHESGWHAGLARYADRVPQLLNDYDGGRFVYLPTGGGAHREANVYGDAVVPISLVKTFLDGNFKVCKHIDDPAQFWQAVVVAQEV